MLRVVPVEELGTDNPDDPLVDATSVEEGGTEALSLVVATTGSGDWRDRGCTATSLSTTNGAVLFADVASVYSRLGGGRGGDAGATSTSSMSSSDSKSTGMGVMGGGSSCGGVRTDGGVDMVTGAGVAGASGCTGIEGCSGCGEGTMATGTSSMSSSESDRTSTGCLEGDGTGCCGRRLGVPNAVEAGKGVVPCDLEAGGLRGPAPPIDKAVSRRVGDAYMSSSSESSLTM